MQAVCGFSNNKQLLEDNANENTAVAQQLIHQEFAKIPSILDILTTKEIVIRCK